MVPYSWDVGKILNAVFIRIRIDCVSEGFGFSILHMTLFPFIPRIVVWKQTLKSDNKTTTVTSFVVMFCYGKSEKLHPEVLWKFTEESALKERRIQNYKLTKRKCNSFSSGSFSIDKNLLWHCKICRTVIRAFFYFYFLFILSLSYRHLFLPKSILFFWAHNQYYFSIRAINFLV